MTIDVTTEYLGAAFLEAAEAATHLPPRSGTVYLLHFDRRYRHAGHYTGWTTNLEDRLVEHAIGRGARLVAVVQAAGIGFTLARIWPGATRATERALKRQGGASRRCPLCGTQPRTSRRCGGAR